MASTWPGSVLEAFTSSPLSGAYNKLLSGLFPVESAFCVVPLNNHGRATFEVQYHGKPVMVVDVSPVEDLGIKSKRAEKDRRMRERLSDMADICPNASIVGLSAFGTKLSIYQRTCGPSASLVLPMTPDAIDQDRDYLVDIAPITRWSTELLSAAAEERIRTIVDDLARDAAAPVDNPAVPSSSVPETPSQRSVSSSAAPLTSPLILEAEDEELDAVMLSGSPTPTSSPAYIPPTPSVPTPAPKISPSVSPSSLHKLDGALRRPPIAPIPTSVLLEGNVAVGSFSGHKIAGGEACVS
ncbi:hypothetical protein CYLTODRAFT_422496 [Cylindrobasidium torrendii FP15055 ss-10]|uniref:Uncharacterized protein n=1 Tax=Cylindrobasidium torrendii FP15055 ss-10 TaxID=1314674 RepID=A0A0D7BBB2_9AGAR|nr:hypothetical protein CYLTODRAFT_422496 [Cylindrobasidium torrendii FP15055 ss-10]